MHLGHRRDTEHSFAYKFTGWSLWIITCFATIPQSLGLSLQAFVTSPEFIARVHRSAIDLEHPKPQEEYWEDRLVYVISSAGLIERWSLEWGESHRSLSPVITEIHVDTLVSDHHRHHQAPHDPHCKLAHPLVVLFRWFGVCSLRLNLSWSSPPQKSSLELLQWPLGYRAAAIRFAVVFFFEHM
jgi:hypothetical protein